MRLNPQDFNVGDRVGVVCTYTPNGRLKHYGTGVIHKMDKENVPNSVGNGFFSRLQLKIYEVLLDSGYTITNKDGFIIPEKDFNTIVENNTDNTMLDPLYIRVKNELD